MLLLFSLCRNTLALSLGLALALFMCFTVVLSMFAADYYFTLSHLCRWFPFLTTRACCEACGNLKAAFLVAVVCYY